MNWSLTFVSTGTAWLMHINKKGWFLPPTLQQSMLYSWSSSPVCLYLQYVRWSSSSSIYQHIFSEGHMADTHSAVGTLWWTGRHAPTEYNRSFSQAGSGEGGELIKLKYLTLKSLPFYYFAFPLGHVYSFWVTQPQCVSLAGFKNQRQKKGNIFRVVLFHALSILLWESKFLIMGSSLGCHGAGSSGWGVPQDDCRESCEVNRRHTSPRLSSRPDIAELRTEMWDLFSKFAANP